MDKLLFSAIIGLVAGVIDIIPMIMQKLPRYSTVSAFFHYFFVSIIILNVDITYSLVVGRRRCRLSTNYPDAYSGRTFG